MMNLIQKLYTRLRSENNPGIFLLSRILWKTGLCRFLTINCDRFRLKFFPTALSCALWTDPSARADDDIFLNDYLKSGDVAIDIGANIGSLTLLSAVKVGHSGKVFAFEPHPKIYNYLKKNILLNDFNNITTYNLALGNKAGKITFSNKRSDDMNCIIPNKAENTIDILIEKLDDTVDYKVGKIALIKIDVEGYEKFALEGAKEILQRTTCLYFESSDHHFHRYDYTSSDLFNFIRSIGFNIYSLHSAKTVSLIKITHRSVVGENLIAIKNIEDFVARTGYAVMNASGI